MGGKTVANKRVEKSDVQITADIMDMVELCRKYGVNEITGITRRRGLQNEIDGINKMLRLNENRGGYGYIENSNIKQKHMGNDKIHLNYNGIRILANNLINALNTN